MKRLLPLLLLLAGSCFAEHGIAYGSKITTHSHGGWPLCEWFGANKGDVIQLDAISDAWLDSNMFFGAPQLTGDDTLFTQTENGQISCPKQQGWFKPGAKCWHEHWEALSPTTGDQYIWAQYLLFGTDAHYTIRLLSSEVQ